MTGTVAAYFDALGAEVKRGLAGSGTGMGRLAEAATAALEALPPGPEVGALPVLTYATACEELPMRQTKLSDSFGQPPLILYRTKDFYIQALTWVDGTTNVHQHGFEGAFAVAEGCSLHVPYEFSAGETLADGHLVTGDLTMKDPEILWPGQVRTIEAGFNFVHALFHLDRPTVTVVVRDDKTDLPFPQYSYMGRGVGWDANYIELRTGKRRQAMATLHRLDPKAAEEALVEAVTSAPTWTGFLFLLDDVRRRGWTEQAGELCDLLTRRAPPLAGLLEQALRSLPRKVAVMSRRRLLTERHQRTFLALLANLPDRSSIEHIVAALYPGSQPDRLVLEWITELASPDYRAISGLRLSEVQMTAIQAQLSGEMPDGTDRLESTLSDLVAGWEPKTTQCGLFGIPEHEEQLA